MTNQYSQDIYLKDFDCFAITFKEFLNWSAYGILRINRSRIHYFDGEQDAFSLIMDSSPDIDMNIKGEYLFVRLTSEYQKQIYHRTTTDYYLKLEAVQQFFVMDDHAYQLLIGRANAAKLSLILNDRLTRLAHNWVSKNKKILIDFKALRFMSVLKFNDTDFNIEDDKSTYFDDFKKYILESSEEINKTTEQFKGKIFYSYKLLNEYIKNICGLEDFTDFTNIDENFKSLRKQLNKTEIAQGVALPLSDYQYAFEERVGFENFVRQELSKRLSDFLLMTLYVHYKTLIEEYFENFGENIVIALAKDLKKLQDIEDNDNNAKILAYEIGSLLPEVFVNHLYYVKNKENFSALNDNMLDNVQKTLSIISTVMYKTFSVQLSYTQESEENIIRDITTEQNVSENNGQVDGIVDVHLPGANQKKPNMTDLQDIIIQFLQKNPKSASIVELMEHIHQINTSYSEQDVQDLYNYLCTDNTSITTQKGKLSAKFLQKFKSHLLEKNIDNPKKNHINDSDNNLELDL